VVDAPHADDSGIVSDAGTDGRASVVERRFDFSSDAEGWTHAFADLPVDAGATYELGGGLATIDVPDAGTIRGYRVESHNRSDDVWMYLVRSFGAEEGILPGQAYSLSAELAYVTTAASGCVGAGGAPGESVILKLGGSPLAPAALQTVKDGFYRFAPDKGDQISGGSEASVISNIASGRPCPDATPVLIRKEHAHPQPIVADAEGKISIFFGTDSGFEGKTTLVYDAVAVRLTPTSH
jgi:hypothetical protein